MNMIMIIMMNFFPQKPCRLRDFTWLVQCFSWTWVMTTFLRAATLSTESFLQVLLSLADCHLPRTDSAHFQNQITVYRKGKIKPSGPIQHNSLQNIPPTWTHFNTVPCLDHPYNTLVASDNSCSLFLYPSFNLGLIYAVCHSLAAT